MNDTRMSRREKKQKKSITFLKSFRLWTSIVGSYAAIEFGLRILKKLSYYLYNMTDFLISVFTKFSSYLNYFNEVFKWTIKNVNYTVLAIKNIYLNYCISRLLN